MATNDDVNRTAVNQRPYGGTDYPFTGPGDLVGIVLDAYVSYYDPTDRHPLPFSIDSAGDNFIIYDANSVAVVDLSKVAAVTRAWGTRTVHEWYSDPVVVRVVTEGASINDGTGVLDPRTVNRMTRHVRSIRVGLFRLTGNVRFESGYNLPISGANPAEPVDGGRFRPQVAMDAVPGGGIGRLSGCDDVATAVKKINKVAPDCSGNFKVEFDDCFRAQLPLFMTGLRGEPRTGEYSAEGFSQNEAMHAIKLYSDCRPCCECDYYVRTYRGLKRMWNRWKAIAEDAERVRDVYSANIDRWEESRQCRLNNPSRLLTAQGKDCKTSIGGSFCNFSNCCVTNIEIRFTFTKYTGGSEAPWTGGAVNDATISGSGTQGDEAYAPQLAGNGRVARFFFDYADPSAMSIAKMRQCVGGCGATDTLGVVMTVHAETPPNNEHTGESCGTPTVDVPEATLDAWDTLGVPLGAPVRAVLSRASALDPNPPRYNCGC